MQIFSKLGNDFKFIYDKAFENEFSLEKNYFEIIVWIIIVKKLKLFGLLIHKCVLLDMGGGVTNTPPENRRGGKVLETTHMSYEINDAWSKWKPPKKFWKKKFPEKSLFIKKSLETLFSRTFFWLQYDFIQKRPLNKRPILVENAWELRMFTTM